MKITITEITDYQRDENEMCGDMGHIRESQIYHILADEIEKKIENDEWEGLPFTCEAEDEEDALAKYNAKYSNYIKATECLSYEAEDEEADDEV